MSIDPLDLILGAGLGTAFNAVYTGVQGLIAKNHLFKSLFKDIRSKLDTLKPLLTDMTLSNNQVSYANSDELRGLEQVLKAGEELVLKCSNVSRWDLYRKYKYATKFLAWGEDLESQFKMLQAQGIRDGKRTAVGVENIEVGVSQISTTLEEVKQRMKEIYVQSQFKYLEECILQMRRNGNRQRDLNAMDIEDYNPSLEDFHAVLKGFTKYSRLRVISELSQGDIFHSANIVSSIEFDRDEELFATAGVSRCIKVFEFSSVINEPEDIHCAVEEISTRSKLSCLSWSKYAKNQIASSDYEGIVTVWDVSTRQSVMKYEEHKKRAWSVDFSSTDPSMLVSGSDDCKVKIWCTNQEESVLNIDMKANICSVKYNPGSSFFVAVGSADHRIHYYDLRNVSQPLHVFSGHRKPVSYVKFLSDNELASASTDSTLQLWDVKENLPRCRYRGHMNEKNFVGLAVNNDYIACGSETNEVFVYHKGISKPMAWHKFGPSNLNHAEGDGAGSYFISAVCWKRDSPEWRSPGQLLTRLPWSVAVRSG